MSIRFPWAKKPTVWKHVSNVFQLLDRGKGSQLTKLIELEQRGESAARQGQPYLATQEFQSEDGTLKLKRVGSFVAK